LALVIGASIAVGSAFSTHKPPDFAAQVDRTTLILWLSAGVAVITTFFYLALEPYARRRAPELMVGWARLLEGRFNDPRVGRDLLVGGVLGVGIDVTRHALEAISSVISVPGETTLAFSSWLLKGGGMLVSHMSQVAVSSVYVGLANFGFYVLLLLVLRRRAVAIPVYVLLTAGALTGTDNPAIGIVQGILGGALWSVAALRFGLLAVVSFILVANTLISTPLPLGPGAAYGMQSVVLLLLLLVFFLYALRVSVGSRSLFRFALEA